MLPKRPLLITLGMLFAGGNAFMAFIVTPLILISQNKIIYNGKTMTTTDFARQELPMILIYGSFFGIFFWSFLRRKTWSRHIVMVFWVCMLVIAFINISPDEGRTRIMFMLLLLLAFSGVYFYLKPNVVAYYDEMAKQIGKRV